jgi:Flp pilus assembly protein TadD
LLSNLLFLLLLFTDPPQTSELLRQGLQALQQGNLQEARTDFESAAKISPENAYVWSSLAEVYIRGGDPKLAASAAGTALKFGGSDPVVCHALAIYYAEAGQFGQAGKLEQTFAESKRADAGALNRAAQFYLKAGDEQNALPLAERAAQANPQVAFEWAQMLLRQQDFTPAANLIEKALQAKPDDVQLTLAFGVARYGQRRFDDAIAAFLKVIQLDPTVDQPYDFLGRMLDQAGPKLAEITLADEKWAAQNPANGKAQFELAKALLLSRSDDPRPEALLRRSLTLDPSNWEAHYQLGVMLSDSHRYPEALQELSQATALDAKQPMPHYQLARVYDRLGQPEKAKAEREVHARLIAPKAR